LYDNISRTAVIGLRSINLRALLRYVFIVALIIPYISYRLEVIKNYIIPTYGNTMYHVGIERLITQTGFYPTEELSYNGGFHHFYVPSYRLFVSSFSLITTTDPMVTSGMLTIIISLAIFGIIYAITKRASNPFAGVCALFLLIVSPEMTIFSIRALPELLGLFMFPLTLYFILLNNTSKRCSLNAYTYLSILAASITALTHQMTLLTLAFVLIIYGLTQLKNRAELLNAWMPLAAAITMYGVWQFYSLHTLNILGLAQVKFHEGMPVDLFASAYKVGFIERTGLLVIGFCILGIVYLEYKKTDKRFLLYAWIGASLILTKNDLFGISIFMDRFLTFMVEGMIIVGGIGAYATLEFLDRCVFDIIFRKTQNVPVKK